MTNKNEKRKYKYHYQDITTDLAAIKKIRKHYNITLYS